MTLVSATLLPSSPFVEVLYQYLLTQPPTFSMHPVFSCPVAKLPTAVGCFSELFIVCWGLKQATGFELLGLEVGGVFVCNCTLVSVQNPTGSTAMYMGVGKGKEKEHT